jgi:hypothetical protein
MKFACFQQLQKNKPEDNYNNITFKGRVKTVSLSIYSHQKNFLKPLEASAPLKGVVGAKCWKYASNSKWLLFIT